MDYKYLDVLINSKGVYTVILNRPEVHNAFNDKLILEMINLFEVVQSH